MEAGEFLQRNHYEVAFLHARVGKGKFWSVDDEVIIDEKVNVDGAVKVLKCTICTDALLYTAKFLFNLLCLPEARYG